MQAKETKTPEQQTKKAAGNDDGQTKVKRAKNAFLFFISEKKATVKGLSCSKFCDSWAMQSQQNEHDDLQLRCLQYPIQEIYCGNAAENPDLSSADLNNKMSEIWKTMSQPERTCFEVNPSHGPYTITYK
jgi:hypothetical protein